jgi:hypothetical protein
MKLSKLARCAISVDNLGLSRGVLGHVFSLCCNKQQMLKVSGVFARCIVRKLTERTARSGQRVLQRPSSRELHAEERGGLVLVGNRQ